MSLNRFTSQTLWSNISWTSTVSVLEPHGTKPSKNWMLFPLKPTTNHPGLPTSHIGRANVVVQTSSCLTKGRRCAGVFQGIQQDLRNSMPPAFWCKRAPINLVDFVTGFECWRSGSTSFTLSIRGLHVNTLRFSPPQNKWIVAA